MPLDLLVPDLVPPPDAPAAVRETRLRALERWLGRAAIEEAAGASASAWLARAYGLDSLPAAVLSRLGEGAPAEGLWMRADPVHLQIEGDALRLRGPSVLEVSEPEARALVAALNAHFGADGLAFEVATPQRWYVRVDRGEAPRTTPLEEAIGRDVFGLLPSNTSFNWRSALTEAQMIFGGHEVNTRRESERRPTINSIWLWGAGDLPAPSAHPYALVYAGDAITRGLARWSGATARGPVASPAEVDLTAPGEAALVVIEGLAAALARGDAQAWRAEADALDEKWFSALGEAIDRFEQVRVILPARDVTRIASLTRSSRWRWFRAPYRIGARA